MLLPVLGTIFGLILQIVLIFGPADIKTVIILCTLSVSFTVVGSLLYLKMKRFIAIQPCESNRINQAESNQSEASGPVLPNSNVISSENILDVPRENQALSSDEIKKSKPQVKIPYYVVRVDYETWLFKKADRYDLLKLSVQMHGSKPRTEKQFILKRSVVELKDLEKGTSQEQNQKAAEGKSKHPEKDFKISMPTFSGIKNKFLKTFKLQDSKAPETAKLQAEKPSAKNQPDTHQKLNDIKVGIKSIDKNKQSSDRDTDSKLPSEYVLKDVVDKKENDLCITCCTFKVNALFLPCLHGGLCFVCAKTAFDTRQCCPFCNCAATAAGELETTELQAIHRIATIYILPVRSPT